MVTPCLRSIGTFAALLLFGAASCSSKALESPEAGAPDHPAADPAACGCQLDGRTLTMSWGCYCQTHVCTAPMTTDCSEDVQWTRGCGLTEYARFTVGGPERLVYDQSGALVGAQMATDVPGEFTCPSDPTLRADVIIAGQLLDTCTSATTCACSADGGRCDPTDAAF